MPKDFGKARGFRNFTPKKKKIPLLIISSFVNPSKVQ